MRAVETSATEPERLTWEQICEAYPDAWVFLADPEPAPDGFGVISGRVLAHSRLRRDLQQKVEITLSGPRHYFTGRTEEIRGFPRLVVTDEIRELVRVRR